MQMVQRTDDAGIAVLRFQNGKHFNSFDVQALTEIRDAIEAVIADDAITAWVLTGDGRAFSTGANVQSFQDAIEAGTITNFILDATGILHPLMRKLQASSKPMIAAVNGVAAGGGLGLALMADVRVGNAEARFAAGYFGIGATPDGGSTWVLPRLIGVQRARRFFLTNEVMGAEEALRTGLLDELLDGDPDALVAKAIQWARTLSKWNPFSLHATKRLLDAQQTNDLESHLEMERGLIAASGATPEFREGVAAFLGRRAPNFRTPSNGS